MRIGVLGSGNGSNCQAIIDAIADGTLDAEITCVLTDVEGAGILDRAARHGIHAEFISGAPFRTKLEGEAEQKYLKTLKSHGVECIALAGFMRVIKAGLLTAYPDRIINIHPSLLPSFPGVESWTQALDYGCKVAGCTVHIVEAGIDTGPILVQKCVPIRDDDTPETLHARVQIQEHIAYPEALNLLQSDNLKRSGRRLIGGQA
jgi:phosphoribosylglycinamide formyltransferase-1